MSPITRTSSSHRAPASSSSAGKLEQGASGAAVAELQQLLQAAGLYGKNIDGQFGPVTEAAVKAFQRRNGLTVDGWVGPQTMAKLRQLAAPQPPSTAVTPSAPGGKLVLGASGPEVQELQLRLKAQGYFNGAVDGNFGPGTEAAVRAFQRGNRMTVDGWAGPQTMAKLRGSSGTAPTAPTTPTAPTSPSAGVQAAIDFGMSHLGAPYVGGASPFRFGTPGNGKTYQQQGQHAYVSPAGVIGFDCSGLMVAMFREAGVDLAAQGLSSSSSMKLHLPAVPKDQLQRGDLLVKDGHVVMYLGGGQVLQSTPHGGVCVSDARSFLNDPAYVGRHVPLP